MLWWGCMEENLYLIHSFSHSPLCLCIMILRYFSTGEEKLSSLEKFICLRFRVALILLNVCGVLEFFEDRNE